MIKNAKLVYKIEEESFYELLVQDIAAEALGFNDPAHPNNVSGKFGKKEATKWIIHYELNKLKDTLIRQNFTRDKFQRNFADDEEHFCGNIVGFLPKKKRKVLWRKLKKDIGKGKLNHSAFDDRKNVSHEVIGGLSVPPNESD